MDSVKEEAQRQVQAAQLVHPAVLLAPRWELHVNHPHLLLLLLVLWLRLGLCGQKHLEHLLLLLLLLLLVRMFVLQPGLCGRRVGCDLPAACHQMPPDSLLLQLAVVVKVAHQERVIHASWPSGVLLGQASRLI